ncbi:hypothetical protein CI15_34330 [Paraburkholderia monticola]|uniref:Uncharacterized protein n=1 Tax=Paraburkholderia monticola TaxID=1399968 RepID=A0A149PC58_9BURK|nr:hypothetical protein CI15_34330 [Paraburkholderia monticola]
MLTYDLFIMRSFYKSWSVDKRSTAYQIEINPALQISNFSLEMCDGDARSNTGEPVMTGQ